jgi:hypothetical protein
MARPKKQTVDYFPHSCDHKTTMYILEQKYGNDGYSFWFKLLEILGKEADHWLDLRDCMKWEFLQAKTHLDESICTEMLNLLAKLKAIDPELWAIKIVWSENFVEGISDVYRNRRVEIPSRPTFLLVETSHKQVVSTEENTQSKVKESKVNKTIKTFPPDSDEIGMSKLLFTLIQSRDPQAKKPDYQKWAVHIDRLIRIDNRGSTEIKEVIEWCQKDLFWQSNILSTEKLREKFPQLLLKMKGNGNGTGTKPDNRKSQTSPAGVHGQSDGEPWPVDAEY